MAGISVKLTADVTGFKKNINEATQSVKTLDAQLETNEKQLKLNGDAELYMKNKAALLEQQLEAQRKVVVSTHQALEAMKKNGVSPASNEFQKMEQNLAKAQSKMVDIQTDLKEVKSGATGAKDGAKEMNTELKKIGKGVAFENITSGLKAVTDKLESAGRAAVNLGKKIVSSAKDSTGWADDVLTRATKWGVDAETVQQMDNVARIIDTDAESIVTAWDKIAKSAGNGKLEELLGIDATGMSLDDAFWAAGEALMDLSETIDEVELDDTARKIFGSGWRDLLPLLKAGREEYEQLLSEQTVLTNEQVESLGKADDELQKMELEIQRLKNEFWAENSQTIIDLLQWLVDHKEGVVAALTAIGGAFGLLKIGQFAVNLQKTVSGFKDLMGLAGKGAETAAESGGSTVAKTAGGGFLKAAAGKVAGAFFGGALTPVTVAAAALAPAMIEQNKLIEQMRADQAQMEQNAAALEAQGSENARFVRTTAENSFLAKDANGNELKNFIGQSYSQLTDATFESLMGLQSRQGAEMAKLQWALGGVVNPMTGNYAWTDLQKLWRGELEANDAPELARAIADALSETSVGKMWEWQRGSGVAEARVAPSGWVWANGEYRRVDEAGNLMYGKSEYFKDSAYMDDASYAKWYAEENAKHLDEAAVKIETAADEMTSLPEKTAEAVRSAVSGMTISITGLFGHANGLFSVPWDGYPAILHKGERVLTARENQQYTYNNYFGNVALNNGLEIDALTESIARRNQRQRSGFGAA